MSQKVAPPPPPPTVRIDDLAGWTGGASKPTIYRWIACGVFPAPVRLGRNRSAWLRTELDEWLSDRIAIRDAQRPAPVAPLTDKRWARSA